ncbi:MAG: SPOR domain-containing protein [Betaproteobacteria bacterium]|nr:SPOR domain-containing protein [Betaproteobacteria bacterium]
MIDDGASAAFADEQGEIRRRALQRLAVAVLLVAAAISVLLVLQPAPTAPRIPARQAQRPMRTTLAPSRRTPLARLVAQAAPPAGTAPRPVAAAAASLPRPTAPRTERVPAAPLPGGLAMRASAPATAHQAPPPPAAPYIVEVGLFSDRDNAARVESQLRRAGIPVRAQTRLYVGPFGSRSTALQALTAIQRLGLPGILTAQRRP